jgi:preprotein translocase subunit SecG
MEQILLVVHLVVALALIGVILMQRSEGGALGIGGGSGNLFSSRGVGNALTRATAILAACFFATSVALTILAGQRSGSVFDSVVPQAPAGDQAPAQAPAPAEPEGGNLLPNLGGSGQAPAQPQPANPQ